MKSAIRVAKFIKSFAATTFPLGMAFLLLACTKPEPLEVPVRAVKVVTVGLQRLQFEPVYAGEVRAQVETRLGFRVGGKLSVRAVALGQRVKAGQLLAQLDPTDYTLGADAARAQLSAAAVNRDVAAADFKRYKELKDQNFISAAELECRQSTLIAAQAQWAQAQAQSLLQNNQAAYTRLIADVSGVVTAVEADPGQVLSAGAPIVRVAQDGPRDAVFAVPEDPLAEVKVGAAAQVRLWPSQAVLKGVVREVAASADPLTRTFLVKVALSATPAPAPALGATVSVVLPHSAPSQVQVIKLPSSALRQEGQSSAVWVLDPDSMTVKLQPVQVTVADGNEWVVSRGLAPGAQVVAAGVHVLSPGQKVTIYKENAVQMPTERAWPAINKIAPAARLTPVSAAK